MPTDRQKEPHPDLLDLELYRTGEAPATVQKHIEQCPVCRKELEKLGAMAGDLRTPHVEIAATREQEAEILDFIGTRAEEIRRPARILHFPVRRVAAGIAAGLVVGFLALRQGGQDAPAPSRTAAPILPGDLNRDGTVDVIDAMLLARNVGTEDAPEVKQLMARIVAVEEEEI